MDYANGEIYKVLNSINDGVYVGSTCQPLSKRMTEHRARAAQHTETRLRYREWRTMVPTSSILN